MHHGVEGGARPAARLDAGSATTVAATLHALATPSRLLILAQLRHGPMSVTSLAAAAGLKQPVVSAQLGLLRDAGMVTGTRDGRKVFYRLSGDEIAQFLDEVVCYSERLRLIIASRPDAAE
ncbi:ArsR/SmtB family transcription factor [Amycolatopsis sp. RTGN1]|uniref:ArsR/SmtB family transcription factor n=1 Tax=Amycolatopsis ponsaeliensis TaxID=2992142 RepID=UPI00254A2070|nr:metalloregulator ArsR/SmtB family transcription factor [Amycolatopsis sp. RTGN1]